MLRDAYKLLTLFLTIAFPAFAALVPLTGLELAGSALAWSVILLALTFTLYAEAMRLKTLRKKKEVELWHYPWAFVVLGVGLPLDALSNVVVGAVWREFPRWGDGEWLLTARLDRWARDDEHPSRRDWARRVCVRLSRYDPAGEHCYTGSEGEGET